MSLNEPLFQTKIVQRVQSGTEYYELLLPDGRSVASGSMQHCWDERERWEQVLKQDSQENKGADWDYLERCFQPLKVDKE